jgi:Xaa-Pro dipeptidase
MGGWDVARRDRALALAGGRPLLTADPASVSWLTGLAVDIEWGPSPFAVPPVAILEPDGRILAVVSEDEAPGLAADVEALSYPGFAVEDVDRAGASLELVLGALPNGPLAVELASLPGTLARALGSRELAEIDLRPARAVKDPDELDAIRASIRVADAGQAAARGAFRAGATELELWEETRAAMEKAAGGRIPVMADFVTGPRTAEVGGSPTARQAEPGDLLLVDLVPRVGAYWADSCATVALGEPPEAAKRAHAAALEALEAAKAAVHPGALGGDVDRIARGIMEAAGGSYPHHTGHGLGLMPHEEPRIVPGSQRVLQPGMIVALEPGAYADGWGVRTEHILLVTESGHEVLSRHDLSL